MAALHWVVGVSRIWLSPNVESRDLQSLLRQPDLWPMAGTRTDVVQLIGWQLNHTKPTEFEGALGFPQALAVEVGAVKEYSVSHPDACVDAVRDTIVTARGLGRRIQYVQMDEPFTSGVRALGWNASRIAAEVKRFVDIVHAEDADIVVGLDEAYPEHSVEDIQEYLRVLADTGCPMPILHLDMDLYRARREHRRFQQDLQELRDFCRSAGIRFGVITWGEHGDSNARFCQDARDHAAAVNDAIGYANQDDVIFQSWSPTPSGAKLYPDNLPESGHDTLTGLLLQTLDLYGVQKEVH